MTIGSIAMIIESIAMTIKNTVIARIYPKQSIKKVFNFVSGLLHFVRNDCKYNNYLSNSEIISLNNKNKNLKSNYYGFLFNKKISLSKGGIEQ